MKNVKRLLASFLIGASLLTTGLNAEAANLNTDFQQEAILDQIRNSENMEHVILEDGSMIVYNKNSNRRLTTNVAGYEVINPNRKSFSTRRKVALINGKAPAKTPITIRLYGTTDLTKQNFNLNKLPSSKEYIQVSSDVVYTGNLGFFQKQLDLVTGINKVEIDFGAAGVKPIEIIIYVYEQAPTVTKIISVVN